MQALLLMLNLKLKSAKCLHTPLEIDDAKRKDKQAQQCRELRYHKNY